MYKDLIKRIMNANNVEGTRYNERIFDEMFDNLRRTDSTKQNNIKCKLYKFAYGNHLSEGLANHWVDNMENEDGTTGGHWTIDSTEAHNPSHHDKWDWYVALNMAYSDFYSPKFNTDDYVRIANQILDDKDAPDDKLLEYYFHITDKE